MFMSAITLDISWYKYKLLYIDIIYYKIFIIKVIIKFSIYKSLRYFESRSNVGVTTLQETGYRL